MSGLPAPWGQGKVPEPAGVGGRPGPIVLATVLFTGPAVWSVHLAGGAALVPAACGHGLGWAINLLTVVCAALIAGAILLSYRLWTRCRLSGPAPDPALGLIAVLGLAWGSISLLVTIVEGVPNLVLNACPV